MEILIGLVIVLLFVVLVMKTRKKSDFGTNVDNPGDPGTGVGNVEQPNVGVPSGGGRPTLEDSETHNAR